MALLPSEIQRIKYEIGYNIIGVGAEPYISIYAVFDQVIAAYITAGSATTASTAVIASTTPAPASITLASSSGFAEGARVVVDVDIRQEIATVQSLSGAVATVLLTKAHTGTYPVTVEGGESIVREILKELRDVQSKLLAAAGTAGLKRAEDIEWFQGLNGVGSQLATIKEQRELYRDELASALGVVNLHRYRAMSSLSPVLY
jgi:hypothetical protein